MIGKTNILIAVNEIFISRSLSLLLTEKGYRVETVRSSKQAWEHIQNGFNPDVLFVDDLSSDFCGLQLCQKIKENSQHQNIYVIWITDRWRKYDIEKAKLVGINEYMTKPFSPSKITRRMREILNARNDEKTGQSEKHHQPDTDSTYAF